MEIYTMNEKLVSVVMPIYNRSRNCKKTIKSVLEQTHENLEFIIVDDFSDDFEDLQDVISNFNDERIKLIRLGSKGNGAIARNAGVRSASGEVVAFLDSDDYWEKEKIESQLHILKDNLVITCKTNIVTCDNQCELLVQKDSPVEFSSSSDPIDIVFGRLEHSLLFQTSALLMYKCDFDKAGGFDEELYRHQDYQLLFALRAAGLKFAIAEGYYNNYVKNKDVSAKDKGWTLSRSIFFIEKYRKDFTPHQLENFFIVQLLGPCIKSGLTRMWYKYSFKYIDNIFKFYLKAIMYSVKRVSGA